MHSEVEFSINLKTGSGKGQARKVRAGGMVPGIVYGFNTSPAMVTFDERDLVKALSTPAGKNVFLRFSSSEPALNGSRALIKELQVNPLKRCFTHADFFMIDPDREIHAMVPIKLTGTSIGVKLGGLMQIAMRDIPVLCKPDFLPESIEIDVTELKLGNSIHVSDITPPEGVQFQAPPKAAVCSVVSPTEEAEGKKEGEGA